MAIGSGESSGSVADVAALEKDIRRISDIQSTRVVLGAKDRIAEIHILAGPGRSPKQIVRDVQSVLMASHGVDVDYRAVSVVQLDAPSAEPTSGGAVPGQPPVVSRLAVSRVQTQSANGIAEVAVDLTHEGSLCHGEARGSAAKAERLISAATLDALGGTVAGAPVDVEHAALVPAAGRTVAICVLRLISVRGDHVVTGAAIVRQDAADAVVRATLDALNRLLAGT